MTTRRRVVHGHEVRTLSRTPFHEQLHLAAASVAPRHRRVSALRRPRPPPVMPLAQLCQSWRYQTPLRHVPQPVAVGMRTSMRAPSQVSRQWRDAAPDDWPGGGDSAPRARSAPLSMAAMSMPTRRRGRSPPRQHAEAPAHRAAPSTVAIPSPGRSRAGMPRSGRLNTRWRVAAGPAPPRARATHDEVLAPSFRRRPDLLTTLTAPAADRCDQGACTLAGSRCRGS